MTDNNKQVILEINGLWAKTGDIEILKGVDLVVGHGEVHAIMGRNGSGKSTLANVIAGHPSYTQTAGTILLEGQDISGLGPTERARLGLFLGFQYPVAIPGVTVINFLKKALRSGRGIEISARDFRNRLYGYMDELEIDREFATRYLNDGFSGGEKKRLEVLQLRMLKPKVAILDETDSGLDIDALKTVSKGIATAVSEGTAVVLITHYQRILQYVRPDVVHVFLEGHVVENGGPELAQSLEAKGYDWLVGRNGVARAQ